MHINAQERDQTWTKGNSALRRNFETGTPVRVFRGGVNADKSRFYVYDGLYMVLEAKQELSAGVRLLVGLFTVGSGEREPRALTATC